MRSMHRCNESRGGWTRCTSHLLHPMKAGWRFLGHDSVACRRRSFLTAFDSCEAKDAHRWAVRPRCSTGTTPPLAEGCSAAPCSLRTPDRGIFPIWGRIVETIVVSDNLEFWNGGCVGHAPCVFLPSDGGAQSDQAAFGGEPGRTV